MTESNTQAVAPEADAQVTPAPEATSAQNTTPTLDDFLNEFDATTAKPQTAQPAKPTTSDSGEMAELRRKVESWEFEREIKPVLARVRGDIPNDVLDDEELTALLDARAKKDPRIQNAYANRRANPAAWAKIEKALNAEYSGKFKPRVDANTTADVEAVAAAMKGTSTKAPQEKAPDYGALDNSQFQKELTKLGI